MDIARILHSTLGQKYSKMTQNNVGNRNYCLMFNEHGVLWHFNMHNMRSTFDVMFSIFLGLSFEYFQGMLVFL